MRDAALQWFARSCSFAGKFLLDLPKRSGNSLGNLAHKDLSLVGYPGPSVYKYSRARQGKCECLFHDLPVGYLEMYKGEDPRTLILDDAATECRPCFRKDSPWLA